MHRIILLLCLFLILSGCAGIPGRPDPSPPLRSSSPYPVLKQRLDAIIRDTLQPHTGAGIKVVSLKTGETVYEHDSLLLLTPASNLKLFTAAAALTLLGAERPVTTTVMLGGGEGCELYLKGCGDALLTTDDLRLLAATVSGLALPAGGCRLVGDVSCFDERSWGKGWCWDDEPDPDVMYISPLSVNGNAITVTVSPASEVGNPPLVAISPATSSVDVRNTATTTRSDILPSVVIERRPGERENVISVRGTVPGGAPAVVKRLSVWRPESLVLSLFRDFLHAEGVPVSVAGFGTVPAGAKSIAARNRTVGELVAAALRESDNLAAESLLKLVAREATQRGGSAEDGVREVRRYLEARGIPTEQQVIVDGSGVSRYNLTTAGTIVRVLEEMYRDPVNYPVFSGSLAVAGRSGTLANRMVNTPAAGRIRGKSGTLSGVSALSGYLIPDSGEPLAFSVMIQNFAGSPATVMKVQDEICVLLSGFRGSRE